MNCSDSVLVTGGAGFIGSNFVLDWLANVGTPVVNLDLLTYAGNPANLHSVGSDPRHLLVRGDICDAQLVSALLLEHRPRAIVHFAAESHVDRSIVAPGAFINTNIAKAIFERAEARLSARVPTVTPIPSSEYRTPAARPRNSVLSTARLHDRFGVQLASWESALDAEFDILQSATLNPLQS